MGTGYPRYPASQADPAPAMPAAPARAGRPGSGWRDLPRQPTLGQVNHVACSFAAARPIWTATADGATRRVLHDLKLHLERQASCSEPHADGRRGALGPGVGA